jgi:hypothetical protein
MEIGLGVVIGTARLRLRGCLRRSAAIPVAEFGARYQLPFVQPDWLPDVIDRYNPTPPPG